MSSSSDHLPSGENDSAVISIPDAGGTQRHLGLIFLFYISTLVNKVIFVISVYDILY